MKRTDGKVATGELPSFLHEAESDAVRSAVADDGNEDQVFDEEMFEERDSTEEAGALDTESDPEQVENPEPRAARAARSRRPAGNSAQGGGGLLTMLGVACWLGAAGAGFRSMPELVTYGLTPTTLLVLGGIAFATGAVRRWIAGLQNELAQNDNGATEQLSLQIGQLLELQAKNDGALGDAQHLMLSLQRQDEKTNNLTKAIKMYGKPLMDIANNGTELAATLAQVKTAVEAGSDSARAANSRLEAMLRKSGGEEQFARLEVGLKAISQRLEDTEVRKSLMRLEDAAQQTHKQVQQLSRSESVEAATKTLQQQLESATARLSAGIVDLRDGNLGGLETTVRDIQREVSTVATAIAQIQAAIKGGAVARPAPTATVARPAVPSAPTAPANEPQLPSAPPGDEESTSGGYQTGTHRSKNKNVLGAIAKLKQMKG